MMPPSARAIPARSAPFFTDRFETDRPPGRVIGQPGPKGILRLGADVEKIIGIDNGALRIAPLVNEGWGRAGIAYGPYPRQNGLAFAVLLTNGHNTSQAGSLDMSLKRRMREWALGSRAWPLPVRLAQWIRWGRKRRTLQMWRRWGAIYAREQRNGLRPLDENLAVGWFPHPVPQDPRQEGSAFVVHATGAENGELWARLAGATPALIRGLQNIPVVYLVVLREHGAAYYAAASAETPSLPAYPRLRPLAIDPFAHDPELFAGLFQSVSGQIGFRADTRVHEVQVQKLPALSTWYGTAHAADRLQGSGALAGSLPERGLPWAVPHGAFTRTDAGCVASEPHSLALLPTETPAGLLHVLVRLHAQAGTLRLIWRGRDPQNHWAWEVASTASRLLIVANGVGEVLAEEEHPALAPETVHSLQVLDDGASVRLLLNGRRVCAWDRADTRLQGECSVGFACAGAPRLACFSSFEAHPRLLAIPEPIDIRPPWAPCQAEVVVVQDDFDGPAGELAGRAAPYGGRVWKKNIGVGIVELNGAGAAAVQANPRRQNPGRTAYTLPWNDPGYAGLELAYTPPGTGRGQWQRCRAGVIFYQDSKNYITASTWLDDYYDGSSFAFFYNLNGFEEIYDATWSNVGRKINWGIPVTARVVMDGKNLAAFIDGEPVLFRSLTDVYPNARRFSIQRVGIVINWEWGDDTGTVLNRFTALGRSGAPGAGTEQ